MRNNKITRKRAAKPRAQNEVAGQLLDGTEVLKTKESRTKLRRWTFEADVVLTIPFAKDADGNERPPVVTPMRTLRLEAISYGSAKEVREDCKQHEAYLRATSPVFKTAQITVRAMPHETISKSTLNQISGYRDMAMILDKALSIAIEEAEQVVLGKAIGSQFVQVGALEATENTPARPEVTLNSIKEEFYKKASATFKAQPEEDKPVSPLIVPESSDEERKPFVPEIVNPESVVA